MRVKRKSAVHSFLWIAFLVPIILWALIASIGTYQDRQSCICSVLSDELQTFPIDAQLDRVYPLENLNPETFSIISTKCNHGYRLWLKIDKYAGIYQGKLTDQHRQISKKEL